VNDALTQYKIIPKVKVHQRTKDKKVELKQEIEDNTIKEKLRIKDIEKIQKEKRKAEMKLKAEKKLQAEIEIKTRKKLIQEEEYQAQQRLLEEQYLHNLKSLQDQEEKEKLFDLIQSKMTLEEQEMYQNTAAEFMYNYKMEETEFGRVTDEETFELLQKEDNMKQKRSKNKNGMPLKFRLSVDYELSMRYRQIYSQLVIH